MSSEDIGIGPIIGACYCYHYSLLTTHYSLLRWNNQLLPNKNLVGIGQGVGFEDFIDGYAVAAGDVAHRLAGLDDMDGAARPGGLLGGQTGDDQLLPSAQHIAVGNV